MPAFSERTGDEGADLFDRFFMQRRVADDAAFADLFFFQLELRLDETDDVAVRLQHFEDRSEDEGQGDKRNVDDDEVDGLGKVRRGEVADVETLPRGDTLVAAELPRELVRPDVIGVDLRGTALKDAVGEAAGGGPGIEDDLSGDVDGKFIEGFLNFETAATDELRATFYLDSGLIIDPEPGLEDSLVSLDAHFPGDNEAFGHLAGVTEPAAKHHLIESFFCHVFVYPLVTPAVRTASSLSERGIVRFSTTEPDPMKRFLTRTLPCLTGLSTVLVVLGMMMWRYLDEPTVLPLLTSPHEDLAGEIALVNAAFARAQTTPPLSSVPAADALTLARRLSLSLTGAPPSLEEIRRLEALPAGADPVNAWLDHLFADRRYADYLAERFARAFVGVETGPFLVYRRRRLVTWLGDQIAINRPYDELVRQLISAEGLWTSHPEANFITVSVVAGGGGPDETKLAARTARAFLGVSLDCMQCHDDKFSDRWKQKDFHQLAAFFAQADTTITGVREKRTKEYEARYLGEKSETKIAPQVPFLPELFAAGGSRREQLARWITHPENTAFARVTVNRTWAILFGRPLSEPVDDIPLEGPYSTGLEELAHGFIASGYDMERLIRVIAGSDPFRRESRSVDPDKPVTAEQESTWAAFPVTPLRPEQVAGSVIQASTLQALDGSTHIMQKLRRYGETRDFVKRYGDRGEDEFAEESGTIPQRLLLMNGKLVNERTKPNPVMNSSTRLAHYAPSDAKTLDAAFLALLSRYPTDPEREHFTRLLEGKEKKARERAMADLYWSLINSTEFSWNR
jgi:hypothetical protein